MAASKKRAVYAIIGPSGGGKSTLAGSLFDSEGVQICEADDYFTDPDSSYHFDPRKLPDAHGACLRRWITLCRAGVPAAVSNTSTSPAEIAPYLAVAQAYGCTVRVLRVGAGWTAEALAARCVHTVPVRVIQSQIDTLERTLAQWPPYWPKVENIST